MLEVTMKPLQNHVLSPDLLQYFKVLQFSSEELREYMEQMAQDNPVMELKDIRVAGLYVPDREAGAETAELDGEANAFSGVSAAEWKRMEIQRKLDWLASTDHQNRVYYGDDTERANDDYIQDLREYGESLQEYLKSQLVDSLFPGQDREIIDYIIDSLDKNGYFSEPLSVTAAIFHTDEQKIMKALQVVQDLDPAGVGCRDLKECLLLQIKRRNLHTGERTDADKRKVRLLSESIIAEDLRELARNRIHLIARKYHIDIETVHEAVAEIKKLNPKPGNAFNDRMNFQYVTPDVLVVTLEGNFQILAPDFHIPRFTVNRYYSQLLETCEEEKTRKYLRDKISEVKRLQDELKMRSSTLSHVSRALVEHQHRFFEMGPGNKIPMNLGDIATKTNLSISTISRTFRCKYLQCRWGVYPMNYFLTYAIAGKGEKTAQKKECNVTIEHIKAELCKIISKEDKSKPLSDQEIMEKLKDRGIELSRRTIAKYRLHFGIPDKYGRREFFQE